MRASGSTKSYLFALLPGASITLVACTVAGLLGGPIALAIAAFLAVSTLIVCAVLGLVLLRFYRNSTALKASVWGLCLYLASILVIAAALAAFGPSQIM